MKTLNQTKDYHIFKLREDNRQLVPLHVRRLKMLIEQKNDLHLFPIIVNSNMEIVDGQHRFTAAQELSLPIYYVIDDEYDPFKMIQFNTTQNRWTLEDYLNYWARNGVEDYLKLEDFKKEMGLTLTVVLLWITSSTGSMHPVFKAGNFKFNLTQKSLDAIVTGKEIMEYLRMRNFTPISIYKQAAFHKALKTFFTLPFVDHSRFLNRLVNSPIDIKYYSHHQDYLETFVNIYNFNMKTDRLQTLRDGPRIEIVHR